MRYRALIALLMTGIGFSATAAAGILDDYPNLAKDLYEQPTTHVYFGLGITPISIMNSKPDVGVSVFQVHWIYNRLDWEIFNAMAGLTYSAPDPTTTLYHFTFRTSPKFRITDNISIGPLAGYELVIFPQVATKLQNAGHFTPDWEPFSSTGLILGGVLSEQFSIGKQYHLRANEVVYKQGYSSTGTTGPWTYYYQNNALNFDQTPIAPGVVFQIELSFLY